MRARRDKKNSPIEEEWKIVFVLRSAPPTLRANTFTHSCVSAAQCTMRFQCAVCRGKECAEFTCLKCETNCDTHL